MTELGTISTQDGTHTVRFEPVYDATPEELWQALTEPDQLRGWLADVSRDRLAAGEDWEVTFGDGHAGRWHIREVVPGHALEVDWLWPGEHESVLRFEVVPQATGGTMLVLDHRRVTAEEAPGLGAGWHAHLEALARLLAGEASGDGDVWWDRYRELRPAYDKQAAAR